MRRTGVIGHDGRDEEKRFEGERRERKRRGREQNRPRKLLCVRCSEVDYRTIPRRVVGDVVAHQSHIHPQLFPSPPSFFYVLF